MRMYEDLKLVEKFAQNVINDVIKKLGAIQKTPTSIIKGNDGIGMTAANTIVIADEVVFTTKMKSHIEKAVAKNWKYLEKGIFAPDFYELYPTDSHKSLMLPTGGCYYVNYSLDIYPDVDISLKTRENEKYRLVISMTSICNDIKFLDDDNPKSAVAITLEIGRL